MENQLNTWFSIEIETLIKLTGTLIGILFGTATNTGGFGIICGALLGIKFTKYFFNLQNIENEKLILLNGTLIGALFASLINTGFITIIFGALFGIKFTKYFFNF
jgi:uncharacterized protein YqgC (DUF456 family)